MGRVADFILPTKHVAHHPLFFFILCKALVAEGGFLAKVIALLDTDLPFVSQPSIMQTFSITDTKAFNKNMRRGAADDDAWKQEFGAYCHQLS